MTQTIHFGRFTICRTFFCIFSLLLTSCELFEAHPYDTRVSGETDITRRHIQQIEQQLQGKKSFRFAVISDTQRWYDATEDVVNAINARGDVDFVIHTGDQADFGATHEFELQRDILNKLRMPYLTIIGNHDCLGTGKDVYRTIYGDTNFAFTAGNVRFVCLNTNALEYDYSEPVPDFDFITREQQEVPDGIERSVVLMHAAPRSDVFNNNVDDAFQFYIRQLPQLQFCVHGHTHALSVTDIFNDGVLYYQCPCVDKRIYLLFTFNEDGYEYEAITF